MCVVQPGLYVLGLINQSAAKRAGIEQGDRLVAIDGQELTSETPFEASAMVQGQQTGNNRPDVTIKVRCLEHREDSRGLMFVCKGGGFDRGEFGA